VNRAWYETFFEGLAVELWRKAVPLEQTQLECDFLEREFGLRPGARVLDVPCGNGRHAVELATRGYHVTGVDVSGEQIREARARAVPAAGSLEWRQGEMRDLPWSAEFDGGFCFGNSFGYLDPPGTRSFLHAMARALKSGARFAMDTGIAAECILPRFRERESAQVEDIHFAELNRYLVGESCIETAYTFTRGRESVTRTGLQWVFTTREIGDLLRSAGLEVVARYGGVDHTPFAVGHPVLVLVAEKVA